MMWNIARKEILSNLLTLRFFVGLVLFLILAVLFTFVLLDEYGQKLENYDGLSSRNSEELRGLMTYQNLKPTAYKPPEVLSIFSGSTADNMGNSVRIYISEVPELKSAVATKNPLLSIFPVLDIALIFKLVISILAILLAYDAISGEKENETLKLMLSNSVPRHEVLLGKFVGGMATITIPIAIGFLVISLILELSSITELTAEHWIRIILMFLFSLVMVSVLFNLGLLFSSITKRSADTLMFLLFLWVLFVLVIPNGSAYLSTLTRPIEPREKADSRVQEIWGRYRKEVSDFNAKNPLRRGTTSDMSEPWGGYHGFATKNLIRQKQKLNAFAEPLRIKYADEAWQATKGYLESMKQQKKMADSISKASPISLYENLIANLSGTSIHSFEGFAQQSREYRQQIIDHLYSIDAFSSIRYFATVKEEHLFEVESADEYKALREKYGKRGTAKPLDVSGIPRFRYRPESISVTIKRIVPDALMLCFLSVFLFMCAFAAFIRSDVR